MKVVVFSEIQWHYVRTRKQQILSRLPKDWPILFLQAYVRGKCNSWRPQRDGNITYVTVPAFKHIPNPWLRSIQDLGFVRGLWNVVLWLWVQAVLICTGFWGKNKVLFVSNIYYGRVLPFVSRRACIYDCNDNHLAFPGTPVWAKGYLQRVVSNADCVVISSRLLRELIEPLHPAQIEEIGNGVDFDCFDAAFEHPDPPLVIQKLATPRIGYAGALAPWIDFELLAHVAASLPNVSLLLVGPIVGKISMQTYFGSYSNVHWLGSQPHDQLPYYVAPMEVTLIPFRINELTYGVNPNKLHEYMALGKPVVSTPFSPFLEDYREFVRIGVDPQSFVEAIQECLEDSGDPHRRRSVARDNSWTQRAAQMTHLLEEYAQR